MRAERRGFALIVVMIAVAGLFALAMHTAVVARTATVETGALHDRVRAERGARAAVVITLQGLTRPLSEAERRSLTGGGGGGGALDPLAPDGPADEPEDKSPELPPIIKELLGERGEEIDEAAKEELGEGFGKGMAATDAAGLSAKPAALEGLEMLQRVGLPSEPIEVTVDDVRYRVTLRDALGGININAVEPERFTRYLTIKGVPLGTAARIAHQLADWRDDDHFTSPGGAEQDAYRIRGITIRNAPLKSTEELLLLPDMTREIYDDIADDLVLGGNGQIHAGTASRAVLASVPGLDAAQVDTIVRLREAGDLTNERLLEVLGNDADLRRTVQFEPSPIVAVRVDVVDGPRAAFDGFALMTDEGLAEVSLSPR